MSQRLFAFDPTGFTQAALIFITGVNAAVVRQSRSMRDILRVGTSFADSIDIVPQLAFGNKELPIHGKGTNNEH